MIPRCVQGFVGLTGCLVAGCLSGWVQEDSPSEAGLLAVYGITGGEVFAAGESGTVLHRKDSRWRQLELDNRMTMFGIWGSSAEQVVVVGDNCRAFEYSGDPADPADPFFRQLNVQTCTIFRSIDGADVDRAIVVGERSRLQVYDGSGLRDGRDFDERILGVSVPETRQVYAVGEGGVYYHLDDGTWTRREVTICLDPLVGGECPTPMKPVLWDVWVGESGEGAAVDSYGNLWEIPPPPEGEDWVPLETGFSGNLYAIHGYEDKDGTHLFAVGQGGTLIRFEKDKVAREVPGTHQDLHGVWVSPDGKNIYAVGAQGTIFHLAR